MKMYFTFASHLHNKPFSCPVMMYSSHGPQTEAVTFGPCTGVQMIGSGIPPKIDINSMTFTIFDQIQNTLM